MKDEDEVKKMAALRGSFFPEHCEARSSSSFISAFILCFKYSLEGVREL